MRINRWLGLAVLAVALVAVFIDGYSYIYRYFNHIPFSAPLQKTQVPTLFGRELVLQKGLDLQGGTEVVLQIDPRSLPAGVTMPQAQDSTVSVMERRVNNIGVREAVVQSQGANRVVVQLPGVDFDRARELVGKTAKILGRHRSVSSHRGCRLTGIIRNTSFAGDLICTINDARTATFSCSRIDQARLHYLRGR